MDAWHTQPPSVTIIPNCSFIFTPSSLLYCYITISFAFIKILCVQSIMYLVNFFCNIFHSLFNSSSPAYNFWLVYIFKCILFLLLTFSSFFSPLVRLWICERTSNITYSCPLAGAHLPATLFCLCISGKYDVDFSMCLLVVVFSLSFFGLYVLCVYILFYPFPSSIFCFFRQNRQRSPLSISKKEKKTRLNNTIDRYIHIV